MTKIRDRDVKISQFWKMNLMDDDCDEYYELQDELNDCEMVISDSEDRYEDLLNLPKLGI